MIVMMKLKKPKVLKVLLQNKPKKKITSVNCKYIFSSQELKELLPLTYLSFGTELAKLAMDILCVPISTVASESTFSLGGRILNEYRSSMALEIVEALVCSRDWWFGEKGNIF